MRVRKFQGADLREAIAQVKAELGADAVIVTTRKVRRGLLGSGIEVTAAVEVDEVEEPTPQAAAARAPSARGLSEADVEQILLPLRSELRALRALIRPMAGEASGEALRAELAALRHAVEGSSERRSRATPLAEVAAGAEVAATAEARVLAFVGPTGVGKTTTIAKLAARAALVDEKRVALVTLDGFRIGGEEQLRTFADLIGVPMHTCHEPARLGELVATLRADLVCVDTAGRSPRDEAALSDLRVALEGVSDLQVLLTLPAPASPEWIDATFERHRALAPSRLVFTKLDEAVGFEELVRAPARLGVPVAYVTDGQRVPEDLEDASAERLLARAIEAAKPEPAAERAAERRAGERMRGEEAAA